MPKVSVIMNCYNGEKYLREAISSVFAQSFTDWEIVFWDNQSTDSTAEIVKSYGASRIRYFRSPEFTSLGEARRNAVNVAQGEWIAFLDSDDIWQPNKLMIQMTALAGTDYVFAYAGILEITADGVPIRSVIPRYTSGNLLEKLLIQFDVNMVTPVIRRNFLVDHKINFEPEMTASEEYNIFVRLAARGSALVQKEILGSYRVYQGSLTEKKISRWAIERRLTLNQLTMETPSVREEYASAFQEAEMRGFYYEARYLMVEGNLKEAIKRMRIIGSCNWKYRLLEVSLYIPGLWNLLHNIKIRRKLISIFNI
jgi:glycosyltransferase involved in cell wall biosynthesis